MIRHGHLLRLGGGVFVERRTAAEASGSKLVFSNDARVLHARGGEGRSLSVKRILIQLILRLAHGAFVRSSRSAPFLRDMGLKDADLPEAYASSNVLVFPSKFEALGFLVNESFASGRPALVTEACGAAGDVVWDGETAYVVQTGDIEALADRLRLMVRTPEVRQSLAEATHCWVASWTPEQNAHAFAAACVKLTKPAQQVTIR